MSVIYSLSRSDVLLHVISFRNSLGNVSNDWPHAKRVSILKGMLLVILPL